MVFASALMVLLIAEILPAPVALVPHVLWTLFDVFVGAIQAFIFALLTILYFQAVLPSDATADDPLTPAAPTASAPAPSAPIPPAATSLTSVPSRT